MTSDTAVESTVRMPQGEIKWSRSRRVAVALASAAVSWVVVVGVGYLLVRLF